MTVKQKQKLGRFFIYLVLIIGVMLIIFPLYVTIVNSFKTMPESSQSFFTFPSGLYLNNYQSVIQNPKFFTALLNTLIITVISIGAIVLLTPMVAYAITKNPNKRFFSFLLYFITGGMFVPFQIVALPLAICMSRMHLSNKFGIIIVYVTYAMIMGVFLCHGYLKTVPAELEESAYLDGAGRWRAFFSIIFPLITPIIATIIILNFLWIWNEFLIALVLMTNSKDQTLMLFIYSFKGEYTFEYNLMFAAVVMSIIPITILYAFLQKYIVTGLTGGAVKT